MKALLTFCEYALGIVVLVLDLFAIIVSLFVALFELPRYIRYKNL